MSNIPFDPSKFTAPKAKPLPVILLLDVSGSMSGEKIHNLNDAVRDMLNTFSDTENSEIEIHVAIITFGAQVKLHQPLASASTIQWQGLSASGSTPLGVALEMAKAMIEDKEVVPSRAYRPTVVLVSDGQPDSGWEKPLNKFISDGRSAKCDRMAMAIGADANEAVLGKFFEGTEHPLLYAENAKQLREAFKYVTMSVTMRAKSPTQNVAPSPSTINATPATIEARQNKSKSGTQSSSTEDGGYW
ncbi:vWA domain-containing protein [Aeromonas bestiarum]|uniref:vWA domain-containing protein n=1 Tax=Aeromonas bestiarum TaxID=105751 RepID=UPI0005B8C257|nr:VWA domain-containing protein [Aeromonas bestiarum]